MVMPGDNSQFEVMLIVPVALERVFGSRCARAAVPWAPAWSPKSSRSRNQPAPSAACGMRGPRLFANPNGLE